MTGERSESSREPDVVFGELPRFVELLRMSHGPVDAEYVHCEQAVEVEELEALSDEDYYNPEIKTRAIFRCKECSRYFWGWFD